MSLEISVRHRYRDFELDLQLSLAGNGITALFGPSGCGKSTLLRALAGTEPAQHGTIHFADQCWQDSQTRFLLPPQQRDIGMVFQDARLFPHLNVGENLRFAAPYTRGGVQLDADRLLHQLQLEPLLQQMPATLSGGQQQRVALARALLSRPRLLLMDEPLSALDQASRNLILSLIEQLQRNHSLPIIYVTHAVDEVLRLAEHMVRLQDGRVIAEGDPAILFGRSDSDPLLSDRALLRGQVSHHDMEYRMSAVACAPGQPPVWISGTEHAPGTAITLSIQARDIALSLHPLTGTSLQNQLPMEVVEINGHDSDRPRLILRFGQHRLPVSITRRALVQLELRSGMHVWALIKSVAVEHQ
ncbi:molybdate transport system ATP-binding protein [Marinobacterium halophilum]|uniref:Molybdate transport system ATP-binding protein n=1 Tax=Marinobacterium halophilum TaxID=267374 RepID=A0A2P8F185_9GAMM|nr:molybdenum ABC transporter ATP-binding protein [Marinobacterium halophilum]PSL15467.1 molybdate transport system ATP-binding protein [Marinobacterium halophilum]